DRVVATSPTRYMVTGTNPIVELRFSDGSRLRCTPKHRLWTSNRGWVHAEELTEDDRIVRSINYAGRHSADLRLPAAALAAARVRNGNEHPLELPEKWDEDLGHLLGWLVGDGCITKSTASLIYGTDEEQRAVMPRHQVLLRRW